MFRRIIWPASPGIRTAASRPSPTCWPEPWSTATAWATSGAIAAGDVQWMTAGSGIIHQEMPKGDQAGRMHGFQLWANLPSSLKMTAPRYQEVKAAEIPLVTDDDGTGVRIVCGSFLGQARPGGRDRRRPDVPGCFRAARASARFSRSRPRATRSRMFSQATENSRNASGPLAVPTEGVGWADTAPPAEADNRSLVLFDQGDELTVQAGEEGIRFLLVSGKPLEEPVAWYGPIVMNTQEQLREAFDELEQGTFLKK